MRLLTAEPRSTGGLLLLSLSLQNNLGNPVFDGVGLAVFNSSVNAFILPLMLAPFLSPIVVPFSSFILWVGIVGPGCSD